MADDENICPNSQHPRSHGKHPSFSIAPSGKIKSRNGGNKVSFGPNVAELTALFSKPNKPSCQINDLSERQKRRMQMLQGRRLQQSLKQRSTGSGTSSSLRKGANLSINANTNIRIGQDEMTSQNESMLGRDIYFLGRQDAGNADRAEYLQRARDVSHMNIPSIPFDQDPSLNTVDQLARIMTWTLRLIMLWLALYEVQLHCIATSNFILSNLQAWGIYFRQITDHVSITEAFHNICIQLIPLQLWCFKLWFRNLWIIIMENYRGVLRIVDTYADRVWGQISWDDGLHLVFVTALLIRCVLDWMKMASRRWTLPKASGTKRNIFTVIFVLLVGLTCRLGLLPVFDECETTSTLGKYCFFIESNESTRMKHDIAKMPKISNPRYSFFDLIAFRLYKNGTIFATSKVRSQIRKEIYRAFMSPFKFHGRLRKFLMILKWAKFLAPLIGTCNKLRGHILDMIRKKHQHVKSKAAQKVSTVFLAKSLRPLLL